MTDDTVTPVDMNDLDAFSASYFDPKVTTVGVPTEEPKEEPEASETVDDTHATNEPTDPEGETHEENNEPEEKPAGKKSAQERINEVVAKQRAAERERDALAQKLRELEAAANSKTEVKTPETPLREQLAADAPNPDALNEDGTPKYKLGEFDPQYIRDLTKWTIAEENKVIEAQREQAAQQRQIEEAQAALQNDWLAKLEASEQELPDIREKIGYMEAEFSNIDPAYGEFLAATIMSCENGPEMLYYLSQNIGEAQKIVASGPAAATLALGRLDAKLAKLAEEVEEPSNKRPSAAPTPPPTLNRGSGGRFEAAGDTNDLAAFEKVYYQKK